MWRFVVFTIYVTHIAIIYKLSGYCFLHEGDECSIIDYLTTWHDNDKQL